MKSTSIEYVKSEGRWYPVVCGAIDLRSKGESSKLAVKMQLRERSEFTGKRFVPIFK